MALTEAGERLLAEAEPILDAIDKAIDHVNALRDKPKGTLRLNMHRGVAVLMVGPLLTQFLTKYPDIKVEILLTRPTAISWLVASMLAFAVVIELPRT